MVEKKKELLSLKQGKVEKLNLLISLQEDLNEANDDLTYQKKLRARHSASESSGAFAIDERDLEKLREISKQQKQQIKRVIDDIQTLRLKAKPQEQLKLHDHIKYCHSSPNPFLVRQHSIDEADENSVRSESEHSTASKGSTVD